ncbi:MAG: response regulator transcription factor [Cyclobacteriaceae bacterium]|nr:response regulator transcription factor [Cyclobacteriaceae bacterium]
MKDNPLNILLVDDHSVMREGLKLLIKSWFKKAEIGETCNAHEAINLFQKHAFDIVITDYEMPEMNGLELTRTLIKQNPKTRVIVLSMHQDEVYVKECINAGAKAYLSKALDDSDDIIQAIERVLEGGVYYGKKTSEILLSEMFVSKDKKLSLKEIEIIKHIANGLVYKEIADKMNISPRTVETHRKNIMEKLGVDTNAHIIRYAIKNGIVEA